jgi:hypothetical protein
MAKTVMARNISTKKCIPTGGGFICIENMTLFLLVLLAISVAYLYYRQFHSEKKTETKIVVNVPSMASTSSVSDSLYIPPLNTIDVRGPVELPPRVSDGIPVNIRTSTANTAYRQVGILTRSGNGGEPLILPLFGRNLLNGRDKWQYYTIANSNAAFNAKLPISVNGRSCTNEYGCDSVSNGDTVYVEGYDDTFRATIYENATLSYIPF